jgi:hypothetical protein
MSFTRHLLCALPVAVLLSSSAAAAPVASADHPAWVDESPGLTRAHVARVVPGVADVVVLDHGLAQGLRVGTPCLIVRGDQLVGEMMIVASEDQQSAALITTQAKGIAIQPGDDVRLKTFSAPVL